MSNFERNIPNYVREIRAGIRAKHHEELDINWGHDCDCDYCDREGEEADPTAEAQAAAIREEIKALRTLEKRLIAHGVRYGVKVEAES